MSTTFTLNGQRVTHDVDPTTPLLWVVLGQGEVRG